MIDVIPAIIPHDKAQLEAEIERVAGFASLVQVDICDGVFARGATWPYNDRDLDFFNDLVKEKVGWPEWEKVNIEVHLMVTHPEEALPLWLSSGVSSVVVHVEATHVMQDIISRSRAQGVSVGLAIKPLSPLELVTPFIEAADFVQVMGSQALGRHGVPLDPRALVRIEELHRTYPHCTIGIDIGVSEETAPHLVLAGAHRLVVGSYLLESRDPEKTFHMLQQL